jgi:hypothetical protein
MGELWNLIKFILTLAIICASLNWLKHIRRAIRFNPGGSFMDIADEAMERIRDSSTTITKRDVAHAVESWSDRQQRRMDNNMARTELQLGAQGYTLRETQENHFQLYEKGGEFYRYDSFTNKLEKY